MFQIRLANNTDLPAIVAIQRESYPESMQEDSTVLLSRLQAAANSCWVACHGDEVCGYLFAYASRLGSVTPLGARFSAHAQPDVLYLHDLAVARRAAGSGTGRRLIHAAAEAAAQRCLAALALVSVQDSRHYWQRAGFADCAALAPAQQARLQTYPGPAYYMVRPLARS